MLLLCLSEIIIRGKRQLFRYTIPGVGFPRLLSLEAVCSIIWGYTHSTSLSLLSNKWNLALLELGLFWMSALETHSRYFKCKRTWKTLRCVAEFNVRGKSQAVGLELAWNFIPGWGSSLCVFTHVALCSSVLLWPRLLASQFWEENRHPERVWPLPQMQCPSLDLSMVSRGRGLHDHIKLLLQPYGWGDEGSISRKVLHC